MVKTVYGFHIIKLLDKQPAHKLALTDMVPGSTEMTIAADIKDGLLNQKIAKAAPAFVNKLRAEYKVEIVDPTLKAEYEALQAQAAAAATNAAEEAMPAGAGLPPQ